MPVRGASRSAYRKLIANGGLSAQQILVAKGVRKHGPVTRAELAAKLNIRINAICGRANELLKAGVIKERVNRRACFITGYAAHPLYAR